MHMNIEQQTIKDISCASILMKDDKTYLVVFQCCEYFVYSPIYDDYIKSKTKRLINMLGVKELVLSSNANENDVEMFLEYSLSFWVVKRGGIKSTVLSSPQSSCLQILMSYLKHNTFVEYKNDNIIGYIDRFKVKNIKNQNIAFVNEKYLQQLNLIGSTSDLINGTVTRFGRHIITSWIKEPLNFIEEIEARRFIQNEMSVYLQRLKKLLRRCKMATFKTNINFRKLKTAIKSSLVIKKMVGSVIPFKNDKIYKRVYRILKLFDNNSIRKGTDPTLDRLIQIYQNIPLVLNDMANSISTKYNMRCNIVYFPEMGFFIETEVNITNPIMKIKDKNYFKTVETEDLDIKIGEIYEKIKERTVRITFKIEQKILRSNFKYFYNFIGEVDAFCSIINYSSSFEGCFPKLLKDCQKTPECDIQNASLKLKNQSVVYIKSSGDFRSIKLAKNSIILNDSDIVRFMSKIILLTQIGSKVNCEYAEIKVFNNIYIKLDDFHNSTIKESSFLREILDLKEIVESFDENSICLVQDLSQYTNLEFGCSLFETYLDYSKRSTIII